MEREPALEAVKVNRAGHVISLATLGQPADPHLDQTLSDRIEALRHESSAVSCGLMAGTSSCTTCDHPQDLALHPVLAIKEDEQGITLARVTCPTAPRFWRWRDLPRPTFAPRERPLLGEEDFDQEWKPQLAAAALCGVLGLTGWLLGNSPLSLAAYVAAYLAGAWFTVQEIWERLQERELDVHFLMLAVALGSAAIGAWGEGAVLLFLFSFAGALEHYALGRTQREIRALFKTAPKTATVLDPSGHEHLTPVETLQPGMRLLVRPGDQFPVDGEIVKGQTAADESNLTGESVPVERRVGDPILSGTLNLWGVVEVLVTRPVGQSALHKIIELIQQAQKFKAPSQRFTDRFGTSYTYAILGLCLAMFLVWWLGFGLPAISSEAPSGTAFYRTMTLLVVASPCALVLSIPSAILAAIAWSARRGILFRGGAAVEKLAECTVAALDKTGTLTTGDLQVTSVQSFPPGREAEVARLAFSLERLSAHPLARAISRYGKQQSLLPLELDGFESLTGQGLRARYQNQTTWVGRRDWVLQESQSQVALPGDPEPTHSEIWLAWGGLLGRIRLRDEMRSQSGAVIRHLSRQGVRVVVLTGDRRATAQHLQSSLGVDDVRAELRPEQKVEVIREMTGSGERVVMVGDGVNDAPSLAAAHVGVAMGARGSDAALEQAEVVLMHDRLENFLNAVELSHRARRVIRQNLALSLGTVVVLVVGALIGALPLALGVLGHEGSTAVVVLNSMRLLFFRPATRSE
jgi:Cd2+/Zn2+-exporting ATPase